MSGEDDEARLLEILQAHGQSFMQSFGFGPVDFTPSASSSKRKQKKANGERSSKRQKLSEDEDLGKSKDEWSGIEDEYLNQVIKDEDEYEDEGGSLDDDFEHSDDEFTSNALPENVIIFSENYVASSKPDPASKSRMKAFLSSKVSKVTSSHGQSGTSTQKTEAEQEDDRTNAQNDAILHKLVHTQLLSGSMTTELELTPAQRRKALAGRILELTGDAKLGKGERSVRHVEKNKAAKSVREGLSRKQIERERQALDEAKNLGNYHPALKKHYEISNPSKKIKRERGMKMGVGSFSGGSLRLGQRELSMATGGPSRDLRKPHRNGGKKGPKR